MREIINIRLLSKFHSVVKIVLFGIFFVKFFDHMFTYALKICQKTCSKIINFFNQSEFRKKPIKLFLLNACLFLLIGCEKHYVSLKKEYVNRNDLASTFVGSPDPRQENPPIGQKLYVEWNLPRMALDEPLMIVVNAILRDYTEKTYSYPITQKKGIFTIYLMNEEYFKSGGFMTYKAQVMDNQNTIIKSWQQQLWVDLITLPE